MSNKLKYITTSDAMAILKVSRPTILKYINKGLLKATKVGKVTSSPYMVDCESMELAILIKEKHGRVNEINYAKETGKLPKALTKNFKVYVHIGYLGESLRDCYKVFDIEANNPEKALELAKSSNSYCYYSENENIDVDDYNIEDHEIYEEWDSAKVIEV